LQQLFLVSFVQRLPDTACLTQEMLGIFELGRDFSDSDEDDDASDDSEDGEYDDDDESASECSGATGPSSQIDWDPAAFAKAAQRFAEWQAEDSGSSDESDESDSDDDSGSSEAGSGLSGWEEVEGWEERAVCEGQQQQTGRASRVANSLAARVVVAVVEAAVLLLLLLLVVR
jgi:hypothetical protein